MEREWNVDSKIYTILVRGWHAGPKNYRYSDDR
jgi:hypothetical protein